MNSSHPNWIGNMSQYLNSLLLLVIASANCVAEESNPLPRAHAHNDYLHTRPLLDALDNGFCSVEADIFLVDGELLVAHDREDCETGKTLKKLYLDPLRERVRANGGRVYENGPEFVLLIDLKSDGGPTYRVLHKLLSEYPDVFSCVKDGEIETKAVAAIISGNRPQELIATGSPRFAGIDGRLSDLDSDRPAHLLPLISDNWRSHFQWRGIGEISAEEKEKLERIVNSAHSKQRKLRFWATPDVPEVWKVLNEAGVDLINTDNLPGLRTFLLKSDTR